MTQSTQPSRVSQLVHLWIAVSTAYLVLIPVSKNYLLYPMILSLAVIAALHIARHGARIPKEALWAAGAWLVFVLYGVAVGVIRDADSVLRVLVFLLVWPLVYFVITIGFAKQVVRLIFYVGAISTIAIGVIFMVEGLFIITDRQFPALPSFITSMFLMRYSFDDGAILAMSGTGLSSLLWWGAMWIASLGVSRSNPYLPPVWLRFLAGVFCVVGSFIAWRRAIIVVLIASPFIALAIWIVLVYRRGSKLSLASWAKAVGRIVACFGLAFVVGTAMQPQLPVLFGNMVNSVVVLAGLAPPNSDLSDPRYSQDAELSSTDNDQLGDLIRENERTILSSPKTPHDLFFGKGFGASIDRGDYSRGTEQSWRTELQYHALFYWTGLIGIALLLGVTVSSGRFVRRAFTFAGDLWGPMFVASVGAVALLVANASNPYLQAPGHMWPLFFPFMIACAALSTRKANSIEIRPLRRSNSPSKLES